MAQNPKQLEILDAQFVSPCTRLIEIECIEGGAFQDVGGKYIILHTGLMIGERAVKRAYSLMPVLGQPGRARIAVKDLAGPGSRELHHASVGARFTFSGPWGKLLPEQGLGSRTLIVATDTGITTALGIVGQAVQRGSTSCIVRALWLRAPDETFLGNGYVTACFSAADVPCEVLDVPPAGQGRSERSEPGWRDLLGRVLERIAAEEVSHVIATGDGSVLHALRAALRDQLPAVDYRLECFFNNPEKKSA